MYKQTSLANIHHTCSCPDDSVIFDWKSTKVIDVDFEQPNKEAENSRILWVLSKCKRCKGNILHGSSFTDYRAKGEQLINNAKECAENWIGSQRRHLSIHHEKGVFDDAIESIWNRYLHKPTFSFLISSNEHGFADYDVTGDDLVKRICVPHGTKKGGLVNVYCHDGAKHGAKWHGSVEKTLEVFLAHQEIPTYQSTREYFPSADIEEIGSISMPDIVGEYGTPDDVAEWQWIELNACFIHRHNGVSGIWEFIVNMSGQFENIPPKLQPILTEAIQRNLKYVIFHQGT